MNDFSGKKIIITGASRGLGSECARHLSDLGAKLVLISRSSHDLKGVRLNLKQPEAHLCIETDLQRVGGIEAGVNRALDFLKGVDVVLHVAGGGLGLREELVSLDELIKLFVLNVGAAVEINRIVVPHMRSRGKGNLVHVGSIASSEAVGSVGYNTVKAALAGYVRSIGRELAGSGIIATGISPGGFHAPGNAMDRLKAVKPQVYEAFVNDRLPRKYMGEAFELLPMIALLCSEHASMMAGCMVPIDAAEGRSYVF